jgi:apolipoprotein D and lipocalin family protein
MQNALTLALFLSFFYPSSFLYADDPKPMLTVPFVELDKYAGPWYELYRVPNKFQYDTEKGDLSPCLNTMASYTKRSDGKITVENTCNRYGSAELVETKVVKGIAIIVPESGNAKLEVNFTGLAVLRWAGIGNGAYWIIGLGPVVGSQYAWAIVGHPERKYGWILSREKVLPKETLNEIFAIAESQGYQREQFVAGQK